jgi:hypothetical protein
VIGNAVVVVFLVMAGAVFVFSLLHEPIADWWYYRTPKRSCCPSRSKACNCEPCKTHREYQDVVSSRAWKLYWDLREVVKELDDPADRYRPFL